MAPRAAAAILSIGDELALGQTLDTNSRWIADRLFSLGVRAVEHATVSDDLGDIRDALGRLACAYAWCRRMCRHRHTRGREVGGHAWLSL